MTLLASRLGMLIPQSADGGLVTGPVVPVLAYPVSCVTIGAALMAVAGLYQINCIVPAALPPGPTAVVITSGEVKSQPNLTIALQ